MNMVCLSRPYPFKLFKGCLLQNWLSPLLNTLSRLWVKLGKDKIWESSNVKLLGAKIGNEFKFDEHICNIWLKANQKFSALTWLSRFLTLEKRHTSFKAFIESQFKYCPLVWMFHGKETNHKTNRLNEHALRTVYNDYGSSFQGLLNKYNSFTTQYQNIQSLVTEIYKI